MTTSCIDRYHNETRIDLRSTREAVTIGLVNNMSDEALKVTARQFDALLRASAGDIDAELRPFALNQASRSPQAMEFHTAVNILHAVNLVDIALAGKMNFSSTINAKTTRSVHDALIHQTTDY